MTTLDVRTAVSIGLVVGLLAQTAAATAAATRQPTVETPPGTVVLDGHTAPDRAPPDELPAGLSGDLPSWLAELPSELRSAAERVTYDADPPTLFVTAAYSRSVTKEPLAHDSRRDLFETIHARPGVSRTALVEESGLARSTVRYHVDVLESARLVRPLTVLGKVGLAEHVVPHEYVELRAALSDEGTAPVLAAVARHEAPSLSDVAAELDRAPSTSSYHVARLVEEGLLERTRDGRRVELRLTDRIDSVPIGVALAGQEGGALERGGER